VFVSTRLPPDVMPAAGLCCAVQCYNRACLLSPDNPDILGAYAAFLANTRGDLELAEEYFCRGMCVIVSAALSLVNGDVGSSVAHRRRAMKTLN
jgi:hypothetical protein